MTDGQEREKRKVVLRGSGRWLKSRKSFTVRLEREIKRNMRRGKQAAEIERV